MTFSLMQTPPLDHSVIRQALVDHSARCMAMVEDDLPMSHLARRGCNGCTACCISPAIEQNQILAGESIPAKAAGEKCKHCKSVGCAIYDRRPGICRGYLCLWAVGVPLGWPAATGVCWTLQPDLMTGAIIIMGHCQDAEESIKRIDVRGEITALLACRDALIIPVAAVVLRSPVTVIRFDAMGLFPNLMADIDPADPMKMLVDETTQRRTPWNPKA